MSYVEEMDRQNILKIRELMKDLPPFCNEYFTAISQRTATRTRLGYCQDLKIFFYFLKNECPEFCHIKDIKDFTIEDLGKITATMIRQFLEYLTYYVVEDEKTNTLNKYENKERGKSRKLSSVRKLLKYFYYEEKIFSNPGELVETPKLHEKQIIRLEVDEIAKLLDEVTTADNLTKREQKFHEHTKKRDLAMMTLLLGTGLRVSECVGINIDDIDFNVNGVKISRKGGNETVIYFGKEVEKALKDYLEERKKMMPLEGNEDALFLSLQNKRINVRAVQKLVKKYASRVTPLKTITPHKLRSTYGTQLYNKTGDIYLVASVLGHKDINTTQKHYVAMEEERLRKAANIVKLRDDDE